MKIGIHVCPTTSGKYAIATIATHELIGIYEDENEADEYAQKMADKYRNEVFFARDFRPAQFLVA